MVAKRGGVANGVGQSSISRYTQPSPYSFSPSDVTAGRQRGSTPTSAPPFVSGQPRSSLFDLPSSSSRITTCIIRERIEEEEEKEEGKFVLNGWI